MMFNLPPQDKLLKNFSYCKNWEEKYLYIIELGNCLQQFPASMRITDNLIVNCQSQVWIAITTDTNQVIKLYGDSDAAIVKALLAIVFIFYHGVTITEVFNKKIQPFFNSLALVQHLTPSRSQGLESIVNYIRSQALHLCNQKFISIE